MTNTSAVFNFIILFNSIHVLHTPAREVAKISPRERDFHIVTIRIAIWIINLRGKISNLVGLRECVGDFRRKIYSLIIQSCH